MAKWGLNQASSFQMRIFFFKLFMQHWGPMKQKQLGQMNSCLAYTTEDGRAQALL